MGWIVQQARNLGQRLVGGGRDRDRLVELSIALQHARFFDPVEEGLRPRIERRGALARDRRWLTVELEHRRIRRIDPTLELGQRDAQ